MMTRRIELIFSEGECQHLGQCSIYNKKKRGSSIHFRWKVCFESIFHRFHIIGVIIAFARVCGDTWTHTQIVRHFKQFNFFSHYLMTANIPVNRPNVHLAPVGNYLRMRLVSIQMGFYPNHFVVGSDWFDSSQWISMDRVQPFYTNAQLYAISDTWMSHSLCMCVVVQKLQTYEHCVIITIVVVIRTTTPSTDIFEFSFENSNWRMSTASS